ncbi:hypothetical protein P280DRAFT_477732 [Massarina eburnea CBS 473.64]|uniref:Uncharacterized protein n=1 Tax=Massarina eburnea CBS 473.64 TaxID=1395130 RepID=A0A6A6SAS4_9PLEO|nr:hypothetical protein P280DRAFT_477732 [Massarina eburnea CBS 473.64]
MATPIVDGEDIPSIMSTESEDYFSYRPRSTTRGVYYTDSCASPSSLKHTSSMPVVGLIRHGAVRMSPDERPRPALRQASSSLEIGRSLARSNAVRGRQDQRRVDSDQPTIHRPLCSRTVTAPLIRVGPSVSNESRYGQRLTRVTNHDGRVQLVDLNLYIYESPYVNPYDRCRDARVTQGPDPTHHSRYGSSRPPPISFFSSSAGRRAGQESGDLNDYSKMI